MLQIKKIALALSFAASALGAQADLVVKTKTGQETAFNLESFRKITFDGNNMRIHNANGMRDFAIAQVQRITFGSASITAIAATSYNATAVSYANNSITVNNAAGQSLRVLALDGRVLLQQSISTAQENINVSALAKGIYVVQVGQERIKFVK